MKKLLRRTWWQAVLVSLLVLLVSGGAAYAAYYGISKTIEATVTVADVVTLPSGAIGVYSDSAGTANLTSLSFGKVPPTGWGKYDRRTSLTVYVKNLSNTVGLEPVKLHIQAYASGFQYGGVWIDNVYNVVTGRWEEPSLLPGEIKPMVINFGWWGGAPAGSYSFVVLIEGKGASSPDTMPPLMVEEKPVPAEPTPTK